MSESVKMLDFMLRGDTRGHLIAIEGNKDIPFEIKRIFYIFGSDKDIIRGQHANKDSEFVLINVSGTSKVRIKNGNEEEIFSLDAPCKGLYIPKMIWKEMFDFSDDSVLLCLASTTYNASEYISDYCEYERLTSM